MTTGRQIAKLFIRGSWISSAMKSMNQEEKTNMDKAILDVIKDPNMKGAQNEFCASLSRTIGFEYKDPEVAFQDYQIAIMRGVVAATYGWGKFPPAPSVFTDPIQRKKFFQTWVFNYLRQILWDNKIPKYKEKKKKLLSAEHAASFEIETILLTSLKTTTDPIYKKLQKEIIKSIHINPIDIQHYEIIVNHSSFPIDVMFQIYELSKKYLNYNIEIIQKIDRIIIKRANISVDIDMIEIDQYEETRVSITSLEFNENDDGGTNEAIEYKAFKRKGERQNMDDDFNEIREMLPTDACSVFDIMTDPPLEFIERFGTGKRSVNKTNIAKFLKISPKEVGRITNIIKHHVVKNGIGL